MKHYATISKEIHTEVDYRLKRVTSLLPLICSLYSLHTYAAEGGYSNYIPGSYGDFAVAVAPENDWTIRNDLYDYQASSKRSIRSGQLEAEADIRFTINLLTLLYKTDTEILGAQYATGALFPIVKTDIKTSLDLGPLRAKRQDNKLHQGDLTLIPGILFWQLNNFHFSLAEYIITPTGDYDTGDLANTGLNYWSFDTNIAATYFNPETGQDYSINIGHTYNTENSDTNYQTGEEIHIDLMFNQFLSDSWAVGLHAFYLEQVSRDSGDGARLGGFKSEARGFGPALLWNTKIKDQSVSFIAKWLHEEHSKNRIRGDHIMLSFALGF